MVLFLFPQTPQMHYPRHLFAATTMAPVGHLSGSTDLIPTYTNVLMTDVHFERGKGKNSLKDE